jgi:hypothetical protein
MNPWRYDPELGTDTCSELTFEAQEEVAYQGRTFFPGGEITVRLPRPIDRATLDDMAGEGGPWGWGGYTNDQLDALIAGQF